MPVGRFLVLQEAARRRAATRRLWDLQAAMFPWLEQKDRQKLMSELLSATETEEEQQARWDASWKKLDSLVGGAQIGSIRRG